MIPQMKVRVRATAVMTCQLASSAEIVKANRFAAASKRSTSRFAAQLHVSARLET
jgi:hypothetical protein